MYKFYIVSISNLTFHNYEAKSPVIEHIHQASQYFQIVRNARVYLFWEVNNSNVKTKRNIVISNFCGILRKTQLELPNKLTVIYYVQKIVMTSYPGTLAPF